MYVTFKSDFLSDTIYESRFSQFESYIWILNLYEINLLQNNFNYKYKHSLITKFVPFFVKNGKKLNCINNINYSFSKIYDLLYNPNNVI